MNKIEGYIPAWLRSRLKVSVADAIKYDRYRWQLDYWHCRWLFFQHYFKYYYSKEVIANYIEDHGPWSEEQDKQVRAFKSSGG